MMQKLLKEPFLHFLVLGALFFCAYELINRDGESDAGQIVITQGRIDSLRASFKRVWQRTPTTSEVEGLIRDYVREEVLAREAKALNLDRDDTVIRRRLRQKMEFIANDLILPAKPSEAELEKFLATHSDRFFIEPRFTFRQVYLNPEKRGKTLQEDAATLLAVLNGPGATVDFQMLGDSTMLTSGLTNAPAGEISRQFGDKFTRRLELLPIDLWHGPVNSAYGVHLVLIENRIAGKVPELANVREEVVHAWADARRREDNEKFYQELLKRYVVTLEGTVSGRHPEALAAEVD